ncbi:biotin/lipoate--protein ligase family protein [Salinarimonas soli]|uniref:BPL/LPL catalytic domain-containing protein n=1 Tax=Salinarimonas soli TaxID=1638099 RepID=A0A5B2VEV6_9HYPH|nr:biotin/lipoate--protein ligase family protein [Salinarimonas soli]KAA2237156.1 hypothetical protein F0L46_09065 [Salinarimonas soli]
MPVHAAPPGLERGLDLPSLYTAVRLRERGDAFAHACAIAAEAGAGTFVHVGRFDLLEFAVVLEPEEPLGRARRAFFAGMAAIADAVAAHCPPEKGLAFAWPDAIRFDGALVGGGRLGWPEGCPEDAVPDWLVFGGILVAARVRIGDPGFHVDSTSLEEEGFGTPEEVIGSFARHLMVHVDAWGERGFDPVAEAYLARLEREKAGDTRGIDVNGDLLIRHHGERGPVRRVPLLPALQVPGWLDPATGGVRL